MKVLRFIDGIWTLNWDTNALRVHHRKQYQKKKAWRREIGQIEFFLNTFTLEKISTVSNIVCGLEPTTKQELISN